MANVRLAKIIEKKRNGDILSSEDISYFVKSVVRTTKRNEDIFETADRCQIGAMLMAIYLKGFNSSETAVLTEQMRDSGKTFEWDDEYKNFIVDKHSTGGVGDKVSLILAPALAALGLRLPMISGRSLSHTGGTLDKLESIPGFRVSLTEEEIRNAVETVGCCIVGQTDNCVPADKVLYSCRELTATVTCSPLVISSIASKKLSEGLHSIVYDVKFGKGTTCATKEEALQTAKSLVEISRSIHATALFTSMESPLGRNIGNSLKVLESIHCLNGKGPRDINQIVSALGAELLFSTQITKSLREGKDLILEVMANGKAMQKFYEMLINQGVTEEIAKELCYGNAKKMFKESNLQTDIVYNGNDGYISEIDPLALGNLWKEECYSSHNHPGVGFTLLKVVGDQINTGDSFVKFHHERNNLTKEQKEKLVNLITVCPQKVEKSLITKRIYFDGDSAIVENY